jgi:hypothetical protein
MPRLAVRDAAPAATVLDATGREVSLASLWQGAFAALVFLRHYG